MSDQVLHNKFQKVETISGTIAAPSKVLSGVAIDEPKVLSGAEIDKNENANQIICDRLSEAFCKSDVDECKELCNIVMASSLVARR